MRVFAFVGCVIASAFVWQSESYSQAQPKKSTAQEQQGQAAQSATPITLNLTVNPTIEKAPCDEECQRAEQRKNTREEDGLKTQMSATDAAWEAIKLNWFQAAVGAITLFVVGATFHQTKRTADAAVAAAKAADKSANAAEQQAESTRLNFEKTERPYIYVFGPKWFFVNPIEPGGLEPWAEYCIANFGKTPGRCEKVLLKMNICQTDEPDPPSPAPLDNNAVVNPVFEPTRRDDASRIRFPSEAPQFHDIGVINDRVLVSPILNPGDRVFLQIWLMYRGHFEQTYETRVTWIWDGSLRQFVYFRRDDPKYNRLT